MKVQRARLIQFIGLAVAAALGGAASAQTYLSCDPQPFPPNTDGQSGVIYKIDPAEAFFGSVPTEAGRSPVNYCGIVGECAFSENQARIFLNSSSRGHTDWVHDLTTHTGSYSRPRQLDEPLQYACTEVDAPVITDTPPEPAIEAIATFDRNESLSWRGVNLVEYTLLGSSFVALDENGPLEPASMAAGVEKCTSRDLAFAVFQNEGRTFFEGFGSAYHLVAMQITQNAGGVRLLQVIADQERPFMATDWRPVDDVPRFRFLSMGVSLPDGARGAVMQRLSVADNAPGEVYLRCGDFAADMTAAMQRMQQMQAGQ
ncbi:MAG: hypothetical protein AAFX09_03180 [Pseudomonadota bacterium]